MKVGKRGKAAPHAAYIARIGQYARLLEHGEKLQATEAGNMPAWAQHDPLQFWRAADSNERLKGTTYREMEIALPRELSAEQQTRLVREWVRQEIGGRHAYQWGIHTRAASDGGEQPHVHLMFSERQSDAIERDPEQYFKRYNNRSPEKGGARKGYGPSAGQTLTKEQRTEELKALRGRWADMCNVHLEQAGQAPCIDMRSYAEQGVSLEPERKQLPSQWRGQGKVNVIKFRLAKAELVAACDALAKAVPDLGREIHYQEAVEGQLLDKALQEETRNRARPMRREQRIDDVASAAAVQSQGEGAGTEQEEAERQTAAEKIRKLMYQQRRERVASIRDKLDRERRRLDIMPSDWTTEVGWEARGNLIKAKKAREWLVEQRATIIRAQEKWRKAHPFMARIGWKNREAWDLEYALEALPLQEAVASTHLQAAQRAWSVAYNADARAWQQENEARRRLIQALEAELEQLDLKPESPQVMTPASEREPPEQDDNYNYLRPDI